jgi:hypothetical protein
MKGRPIKPSEQDAFIAHLSETGNVRQSCQLSGFKHVAIYKRRKDDAEFAKRWDDAMDLAYAARLDLLKAEALRRAHDGVEEPVFYLGVEVAKVRKYSDSLLMFMIKQLDPSFRERATAEINNAGGGAIHVHITPADQDL